MSKNNALRTEENEINLGGCPMKFIKHSFLVTV